MTALKDTLTRARDEARKAQDEKHLTLIGSALNELAQAELGPKGRIELTEKDEIKILRKYTKKIHDAADEMSEHGATERAKQEHADADYIESFLPEATPLLTEDELKTLIGSLITDEDRAQGMKAMGRIMGQLSGRDEVDNTVAARLVRNELSGK